MPEAPTLVTPEFVRVREQMDAVVAAVRAIDDAMEAALVAVKELQTSVEGALGPIHAPTMLLWPLKEEAKHLWEYIDQDGGGSQFARADMLRDVRLFSEMADVLLALADKETVAEAAMFVEPSA